MRRLRALAAGLLLASLGQPIWAAVPQRLNYQGKLGNASGDPLSGTYSFRFKLFPGLSGGSALFSEDVTGANAVSVVNGIYTVQIGSFTSGGIPYGVFDGQDLYLEIDVNPGSNLTGAETLTPRERLNSSAWAIHALGAERLGTGAVIATFTSTGHLFVPSGVTSSSGTFTATGGTQYSLQTSSGISVGGTGGVTAAFFDGMHKGDGSRLTNLPSGTDTSRVAKTGDTMTGTLALTGAGAFITAQSSITTTGGLFGNGAGITNLSPANIAAGSFQSAAYTFPADLNVATALSARGTINNDTAATLTVTGGTAGQTHFTGAGGNLFTGHVGAPGGLTASSGTFTATGNSQYSVRTSSGISVNGAGGVTAAFFEGMHKGDGSRLTNLSGSAVSGSISGNAGTASALAANGANCSVGSAPLGVDASGAAEGCFDVGTQAELDGRVAVTGDTMTGALTMSGAGANVVSGSSITTTGGVFGAHLTATRGVVTDVPSAVNVASLVAHRRDGNNRWAYGANGNSGTDDFSLFRYNDAGGFLGEPVKVIRASGNVGINNAAPATTLDVGGSAQFGSGATKSTFTTTGALNLAGTLTASAGLGLYLDNPTANNVIYAGVGVGAPTFTTRSAGTKSVWYPGLTGSSADYATGIESSTLWFSVPTTAQNFRWYGGTTQAMSLTGAGNLSVTGSVTAASFSGSISGNATTASALAANGANCSAGSAPLGVDASGAAEGCFDVATQTELSQNTTLSSLDDRTIAPNEISSGRMHYGFTSWANNNSSPFADYLHLRGYTDSSGGNDNLVMFRKDAIGMRIYQQAFGSATAYSSFKDVAFTDGTNATGTWGIGITGNAGTVTNGVYTTGSYSNPAWLTGLAGSKLSGYVLLNNSGVIGSANNSYFDVGAGRIGAGTSVYSYGSICAGNAAGDCSSTGGTILNGGAVYPGSNDANSIGGSSNRFNKGWFGSGGIDVTGNVGIGVAAGAPLSVAHEASYTFPNPGSSAKGGINLRMTTSNRQTGITFSRAGADDAMAGIYAHQDNSAGTHLYFAATDSYATGPQVRMSILNNGKISLGSNNHATGSAGTDVTVAGTTFFGTGGSYKVTNAGVATLATSAFGGLNPTADNVGNIGTSALRWTSAHAINFMGNHVAGPDLAEHYPASEPVEPGDLVVFDSAPPKDKTIWDQSKVVRGNEVGGKKIPVAVRKSTQAYQPGLLGVISTAPGVMLRDPDDSTSPPVALIGRVPVKVCDENGPIKVGDRLTSSGRPGYAMRATGAGPAIAIALQAFDGKEGKILAFVQAGEANVTERLKELSAENEGIKARLESQGRLLERLEREIHALKAR